MTIEEFKDKRKFIERLESIKNFLGDVEIEMVLRSITVIDIWEGEIDNEPFKSDGDIYWKEGILDFEDYGDEKIGGILKLIELLNNYDINDLNSEILHQEFDHVYLGGASNGDGGLDYENIKFTNKISSKREEILKGKIKDSDIHDIAYIEESTPTFDEGSIDEIFSQVK
ncbi:MAG: hypothetical protein CBC28_03730 [Flavobacteriaceae bacterium TMED68]|nr:MAG: hypothetical protein CBC28_03730 [Flavobacteriaceae bacterium TMED68]